MPSYVNIEVSGGVGVATLNRPEALNAIDGRMRSAVIEAMNELNRDCEVRAIVLTGSGQRAFSAGQDLEEAARFEPQEVEGWMNHQRAMFQSIRDLNKPLVVGFNGTAAGTGFQIGLLADVRVGHPDLLIGQPEVRVGLASILGSYLMTLHLGQSHNVELSLLGKLISGERALALGLLNYLVPPGDVLSKALEVASEFAQLPANALRLTKERFRMTTQPGFDEACEAVIRYHRAEYATGEPQEIMNSFLNARSRRRHERQATGGLA